MTTLPLPPVEADVTDVDDRSLHTALLEMYRSLIKLERHEYERLHGEQSEDDFIQVLAYAESLRWLDALTRLIVMLDLFDNDQEFSRNASKVVARKIAGMISEGAPPESSFSQHYQRHLKNSDGFSAVHTGLVAALKKFE